MRARGNLGGRVGFARAGAMVATPARMAAAQVGAPVNCGPFTESFNKADGIGIGPDLTWGETYSDGPDGNTEFDGYIESNAYTLRSHIGVADPTFDGFHSSYIFAQDAEACSTDMYVQAVLAGCGADATSQSRFSVIARTYGFGVNNPSGIAFYFNTGGGYPDLADIRTYNGSGGISVLSVWGGFTYGSDISPGDLLRIEATDTGAVAKVNGATVITYTGDTTAYGGQLGGLGLEVGNTFGNTFTTEFLDRWDDFEVGPL